MSDEHRHPGYEAALADLARTMDELARDLDELRDVIVADRAAHAEYRDDITRLYAAMSEHLRNGHP